MTKTKKDFREEEPKFQNSLLARHFDLPEENIENELPKEENAIRKEVYRGMILYLEEDEAEIMLFTPFKQQFHRGAPFDYFPLSSFHGKKPKKHDSVEYHLWEGKDGRIGWYFKVVKSRHLKFDELPKDLVDNMNKFYG